MPDSDSDEDTDDEGMPKEAAMVSWYPSGRCSFSQSFDSTFFSIILCRLFKNSRTFLEFCNFSVIRQIIHFRQIKLAFSSYPGEEEILFQKDLALKSRVLDPGMGVERSGDFRSGVLLDITANCSVKLVGTNVKVSNVPGNILTPWNVCPLGFYL